MKRIEFIAPVEAMRGNLSGNQDLVYAENDNKAFDGPLNSVNYARNYSPRFIGAKRASDNRKYFTVRTKSANHLTPKSKLAMAVLGGAGALYAALVADKSAAIYQQAQAYWLKAQEFGEKRSFRKCMMDYLMDMVRTKKSERTLIVSGVSVTFHNPWNLGGADANLNLSPIIVVKFWSQLNGGPTFHLAGFDYVVDVILNEGDRSWVAAKSTAQPFTTAPEIFFPLSGTKYVQLVDENGAYVTLNDTYQLADTLIVDGASYDTTEEEPA